MLEFFKKRGMVWAEIAHRRIFGHEMSEEMRVFLGHLSWSFLGGFIAGGIMFAVSILAGRILGPEEFGKYNSLLSIAAGMTFFFLLGNEVSSVRYLADEKYDKNKKNIFSTTIILTFFQSFFFVILAFVFHELIEKIFSLDFDALIITLVFSFVLAIKSLTDGFLRAFHLIKKQSCIRVLDAIISLFSFLVFYYLLRKTNHYYYIIAVSAGASFFVISGLWLTLRNRGKFNWKSAKLLINYNKFLIAGSLAGFIISLEKYFVGRFIGTKELGIFSAYHAASFLIISNLGSIFMNVFWPSSIKEKKNLKSIIYKLNILFLKTIVPWIVLDSFVICAVISLMGKEYPVIYPYIIFFAISSFAAVAFSVLANLLRINRIKESVIIYFLCYGALLLAIILTKNIFSYLVTQIFIYVIFYLISYGRLKKDFAK